MLWFVRCSSRFAEDFLIMDGMNARRMKRAHGLWCPFHSSSIFYSIRIFENDSFVVPSAISIGSPLKFDRASMMFATDRRNPSADIDDRFVNVDKHIEHLHGTPKPIVHCLECDSSDLCKHERRSADTKPIDLRHDDWSHAHESLTRKIDQQVESRREAKFTHCNPVYNTSSRVNAGCSIGKRRNNFPSRSRVPHPLEPNEYSWSLLWWSSL